MNPRDTVVVSRGTVFTIVRVLAGAAILWYLIARIDFSQLTIRWDARTAAGFAATFALLIICQVLSTLRWRLVLGDEPAARFGHLLRLYLVGLFFSLFLPTSVGGDTVRAVAISRQARKPAWAVLTVLFERILGLIAMFALLFAGAAAAPVVFRSAVADVQLKWHPTALQIGIAAAVMLIGTYVVIRALRTSPKLARVREELLSLWKSFRDRPRAFTAAFFVSVAVQTSYVLAWLALAVSLRIPVQPAAFFVFVPFVSIAAMLPVTVSGIGLREGAWVLLLKPYGVAAADAIAFSLLYFLAFVAIGIIGGVIFAVGGFTRDSSPKRAQDRTAFNRVAESVSQL